MDVDNARLSPLWPPQGEEMGVICAEYGFIHTVADFVSIDNGPALRLHTKLEDNAFKISERLFQGDY